MNLYQIKRKFPVGCKIIWQEHYKHSPNELTVLGYETYKRHGFTEGWWIKVKDKEYMGITAIVNYDERIKEVIREGL